MAPNRKHEVHRFWIDLVISMCQLKSPCKQPGKTEMHWWLGATTCSRPEDRRLRIDDTENAALVNQ